MLYPEIAKLMEGMPSRYSLVIVTAKRARQLAERNEAITDKHVSHAIGEISEGKVKIRL
ncbi:MAG: DNA-directed RNA polymerase subunit omega [Clostridia bacterium]|nr:DNA-directed RNA polymerase subunit omega [Clostridia bacterium]